MSRPDVLDGATARDIAVAAQRLDVAGRADPSDVIGRLGCVQLDSIVTVRPAQHLVLLARGVSSHEVSDVVESPTRVQTFEYWAHAMSLVLLQDWELYSFRRRHFARRGWRGPAVDPAACTEVRTAIRTRGPLTLTQLGGAKGRGWERTSANRWAVEWLQALGEVVVLGRSRGRKVYSLTEAQQIGGPRELTDDECLIELIARALRSLGVATADDIIDYYRLPAQRVTSLLRELTLPTVRIEG